MPTVRVTSSVGFADGRTHNLGEQLRMTPDGAQEAVAGGWGEIVRDEQPETPEGPTTAAAEPTGAQAGPRGARRQPAPERRRRR